ncbi:MAG: rhomboid family GlyGly-CTERM serine protease [Granulosicoccus sp.]|jgi:rhomboid family GlyGly-CTERM serine protease
MIQTINNLLRSPAHQLALCVAILCISLQYAGLDDFLRWERSLIDQGHWWLLLTGNFVHLGLSHLWMNIAGFTLVVALVWTHFSAKQWFLIIVFSSLVVGVGLWFFNPEVAGYVGFSGTLHGLIIAGCLADLRNYPKSSAILLALIVTKLIWEQIAGPLPGSESTAGGSVLVDSHLYGAIGGAIVGAGLLSFMYVRNHVAKG